MYVPRKRRGFAAYPTDAYYDPNRPSWMPYWIDDSTETNAKAALLLSYVGGTVTPQEVVNPGSVYTAPLPPPANPAVSGAYGSVASPYDCVPGDTTNPNCPGYDAALAVSTAQQKAAADAAAIAAMQGVASNIKSSMQALCPGKTLVQNADGSWSCPTLFSGIPTWVWFGVAGLAAFAMVGMGGGSPRRYGR